jgi:hypothetical protein
MHVMLLILPLNRGARCRPVLVPRETVGTLASQIDLYNLPLNQLICLIVQRRFDGDRRVGDGRMPARPGAGARRLEVRAVVRWPQQEVGKRFDTRRPALRSSSCFSRPVRASMLGRRWVGARCRGVRGAVPYDQIGR